VLLSESCYITGKRINQIYKVILMKWLVLLIIIAVIALFPVSASVQQVPPPVPSDQYMQKTNSTSSIGTGVYEFRSNIEGARVYLDSIEVGTITDGILQVSVPVFDRQVSRQLMLEADGYYPYNETLMQGPKTGDTLIVRGILQVVPKNLTGSLSLAVSPPGAAVSIDGVPAGVVDQSGILTLRTQKAGYHTVKATLKGYQDSEQRINIEANLENKARFALAPVTTGTIQISSTPSGAQVKLNGALYGVTPVTAPNLTQGSYTIDIVLPGYQPYQSGVQLVAGEILPVSAQLQPVPTPTPTPVPTTQQPTPTPTPTPAAGLPFWVVAVALFTIAILLKREE
jgi:hypothetical protein